MRVEAKVVEVNCNPGPAILVISAPSIFLKLETLNACESSAVVLKLLHKVCELVIQESTYRQCKSTNLSGLGK